MRPSKFLAFLLLVAVALPGCSGSKTSRAEREYAKYVRKSSAMRKQQRVKVQRSQQEIPETEARTEINTSTE